jgi:hypothetical protein
MKIYNEVTVMKTDDAPKTLASVEKTLAIVEALWKLDGAGVTELATYHICRKSGTHSSDDVGAKGIRCRRR